MKKEVVCIEKFGISHDGKLNSISPAKNHPVLNEIYVCDEVFVVNGKNYYHIVGCDDELRCYWDSKSFTDLIDLNGEIAEALKAWTPCKNPVLIPCTREEVEKYIHTYDAIGYLFPKPELFCKGYWK